MAVAKRLPSRIAADGLHRLVAQSLDQTNDVIHAGIIIAMFRVGAQLGAEPLMAFEFAAQAVATWSSVAILFS